MYLEKFMNENEDWQARLSTAPYCLEIKQDGPYFILKYDMLNSDFSRPEVLEARGSIFRCVHNEWRCVCRAMDKFGNWGESYAATRKIDWSRGVSIQEKVDGSIIKCWFDEGFHISTNGTIDAFKAECGDSTFGDVFVSLLQDAQFFNYLNKEYTYYFEMVHPQYNPIVIHYDKPAIYYLGCRNMTTMEESSECVGSLLQHCPWIKRPRLFHYSTLDECLAAAHNMGEDEEGYVICAYNQMENDSFLRIKVKGDEYLKRHRMRGDGPLTTTKIISMYQDDSLDDFLAYFPENAPQVDEVIKKLHDLQEKADIAYEVVKGAGKRRDFALRAQSYIKPIQSYLFARLDNKVTCAQTYFKQMKAKNLAELLNVKEIGI